MRSVRGGTLVTAMRSVNATARMPMSTRILPRHGPRLRASSVSCATP
jgi:hypothetical protein